MYLAADHVRENTRIAQIAGVELPCAMPQNDID
jgi:hypothetical protein